jgi:outer membrane protein, heavy metal efflux system
VTLSLGVQRDEDLGLTQAVVGLAVPLPLFDRNHGNLVTAAARTAEARDDQLALRNRLRSEAYAARERLVAARSDAQALLVDVLPGARMVYEAAITGFKLGKFSFLEVLDAQRTLIDAQSRHVEAVAAAHQAAADIQRLIGTSDTPATSSASAPEEHRQ